MSNVKFEIQTINGLLVYMKESFLRMTLMVMGIDLTMPKNKTKSNLAVVLTGKRKENDKITISLSFYLERD